MGANSINKQQLIHQPILIVDDNLICQKIAQRMLAQIGYPSDPANNGQHALEKLATSAFDIILMDVKMPVMNGIEATLRIRETIGPLPFIIAYTAGVMLHEKEACFHAGMNYFLAKPIQLRTLSHAVAEATIALESSRFKSYR